MLYSPIDILDDGVTLVSHDSVTIAIEALLIPATPWSSSTLLPMWHTLERRSDGIEVFDWVTGNTGYNSLERVPARLATSIMASTRW